MFDLLAEDIRIGSGHQCIAEKFAPPLAGRDDLRDHCDGNRAANRERSAKRGPRGRDFVGGMFTRSHVCQMETVGSTNGSMRETTHSLDADPWKLNKH
ncbi:MAG TPA: hypothetical protein VKM94_05225 [Blastocatellia bacterium]|nr:hypothetical protein [Blastocatellia bacterium]